MKVNSEGHQTMFFDQIGGGTLFSFQGGFYLRIEEGSMALNVVTGTKSAFSETDVVLPYPTAHITLR